MIKSENYEPTSWISERPYSCFGWQARSKHGTWQKPWLGNVLIWNSRKPGTNRHQTTGHLDFVTNHDRCIVCKFNHLCCPSWNSTYNPPALVYSFPFRPWFLWTPFCSRTVKRQQLLRRIDNCSASLLRFIYTWFANRWRIAMSSPMLR